MDTASNGTLEDEFGTSKEEDVVQQILEKGSIVESEVRDLALHEGNIAVLLTCLRTPAAVETRTLLKGHRLPIERAVA